MHLYCLRHERSGKPLPILHLHVSLSLICNCSGYHLLPGMHHALQFESSISHRGSIIRYSWWSYSCLHMAHGSLALFCTQTVGNSNVAVERCRQVDILFRHSTLHHPPTKLGLFNREAISSPINSDHFQIMSLSLDSKVKWQVICPALRTQATSQ